jgi:uncharacterized membrane protein
MSIGEPRPPVSRPDRIESVDLLRGLVMVIMALDHVRDFFSDRMFMDPVDLKTTTVGIFLTRWITHYCAPTFIFLAGTSAFLSRSRGKSKAELSWFLFTRGIWLAVFEVTVNRALWMFNFDFVHHGAGVFWAIGWSMIVLSALVWLPTALVTLFGVLMIGLHNMLDGLSHTTVGLPQVVWTILHQPGDAPIYDEFTFGTGYCVVPWAGVMAAGYGFGTIFVYDRRTRRTCLFALGALLIMAFIGLRYMNIYGDPKPWSEQPTPLFTVLSFLNCTKYPPSLLYLLMTLGPAIFALGVFDRPLGAIGKPIITFGRVPLFYYVLHIPLIHGGAVLLDYIRFGWSPQWGHGPWEVRPGEIPDSYGVGLPAVYLIWIVVLFVLYWPCRWFAEVKRRNRSVWLSYL